MTTGQHIPVSALQPGSECIIHSLGSDEKTARRLAQMGILPGTHLHIIRVAPLGGTIEAAADQGQNIALRREEVTAMVCKPVAMPLDSGLVTIGRPYKVRMLLGGKTFRRRIQEKGIEENTRILIQDAQARPFPIHLVDRNTEINLGRGEAEKIIVEVIDDEQSES